MNSDTDDSLALAAASGDGEAFARLYDRYAPRFALVLRSFAQDQADLEDLIHDAFCSVIHGLSSYTPRGLFHAWAIAIAVNTGRKHVRNRHLRPVINDPVALHDRFHDDVNPEDELTRRIAAETLLRRLPEPRRTVMVLRFWLDYSYDQIGRILKIPPGTAHRRVHTAISEIRTYLSIRDNGKKEAHRGTES